MLYARKLRNTHKLDTFSLSYLLALIQQSILYVQRCVRTDGNGDEVTPGLEVFAPSLI